MTDRSKFEQMLEYLISEEQDKAKEIFHQLVVEKSREIYETILSEDFDEVTEEEDEGVEEDYAFEGEDEESEDDSEDDGGEAEGGEDDGEVGGDDTDDFMGDIDGEEDGGEEGGGIEDRVMDLEDALDDLRAQFEMELGGGDEGGMDGMDGMGAPGMGEPGMGEPGMGDMGMGGDEFGGEEEEIKDSFGFSENFMREYIEKVTAPKHGHDGENNTSIVAKKNDMGGTTANIAKGGTDGGKGVQSGLLKPNTKEENFGNVNVPGGNAGKTAFKKKEPGHGAERKGSGDNGDKGAGSPINGAPKRAK